MDAAAKAAAEVGVEVSGVEQAEMEGAAAEMVAEETEVVVQAGESTSH